MNTQKQLQYQYKYYYIVDVWNGEGYSDSEGYLIKIETSNAINEYITLLNYRKSLTVENITEDWIELNKSISFHYGDADTFDSRNAFTTNDCCVDAGCVTAYEWDSLRDKQQLMIAPTVCHHEFDDEWEYDFLGMAEKCITDGHEDSTSEQIFNDVHTDYDYENADFILFNLKDVKLEDAKLVGGVE
jgi:hypothetical protein